MLTNPFSYQITATNFADTFTAENLPGWLDFDPATGTLSGTPTEIDSHTVSISASNLTGSDSENLQIDVLTDPYSFAVDTTGLDWISGGDAPWTTTTAVSHDGVDSAVAGPSGNFQNNWLATTVVGPETVSFAADGAVA